MKSGIRPHNPAEREQESRWLFDCGRRVRVLSQCLFEALCKLIARASQSVQEPLQRIAGTLTRWGEPIVRYIRNRYTNGMIEGFNNKIKLIQRMATVSEMNTTAESAF